MRYHHGYVHAVTARGPFLLLALCCFVISVLFVEGTLISSSKLEHCLNYGSSSSSSSSDGEKQSEKDAHSILSSCKQKFVVSLTVDGMQDGTEIVSYFSTAEEAEEEDKTRLVRLDKPIKITLRKSLPLLRYPVVYRRNFNAQPQEKVKYTGALQCHDEATDNEPTCGRAYDDQGQPIRYSEGFCCSCSMCELLGLCQENSRANTNCALLGNGGAAHCLVFHELWYSGYDIGPAETWYDITVSISQKGGFNTELHLGPDQLGAHSSAFGVVARLVGDFASFRQPLSMEHRMLFIPSVPSTHPRVTGAVASTQEWLLLDKTLVSQDGAACNKIGVSYEAFYSQGERCQVAAGTCLANQIEQLRTQDLDVMKDGRTSGQYFLTNFGKFDLYEGPGNRPYLAYPVHGAQASLLTLTFVADNISFSINVASGKILNTSIRDFEVNSKDGKLLVIIVNTGNVPADFHLTVTKCTRGTFPILTQIESLVPLQAKELIFDIRSENIVGQQNQCNVTLLNSIFEVVDSQWIRWNSTTMQLEEGTQGGTGNGANGGAVLPPGSPSGKENGKSCTSCPFYNPLCFILRKCFWQIIVQVLLFILIIALIVLVIKHRRCLCACCYESEEEKEERKAKEQEERLQRQMAAQLKQMQRAMQQQQMMAARASSPTPSWGYLEEPRATKNSGAHVISIPPIEQQYHHAINTPKMTAHQSGTFVRTPRPQLVFPSPLPLHHHLRQFHPHQHESIQRRRNYDATLPTGFRSAAMNRGSFTSTSSSSSPVLYAQDVYACEPFG